MNLELLKRVPEKEMTVLVNGYLGYVTKYKYLRYIIIAVVVVIVGYNFFVSGKRFPIDELQRIQIVIASIMGVVIITLLVLAFILFKTLRKLKKELNTAADKHDIEKKALRKEFHAFIKATIGGPGLR